MNAERNYTIAEIKTALEDKLITTRCACYAINLALDDHGCCGPEEDARIEGAIYAQAELIQYICEDIESWLDILGEHTDGGISHE